MAPSKFWLNLTLYLTFFRIKQTCCMNQNKNKSALTKYIYDNLSCPFEWSKYSCSHQPNKANQAKLGLKFATTQYQEHHQIWENRLLSNQRVIMVGDSLLRQMFIGTACALSHNHQVKPFLEWATNKAPWPCHSTSNCISIGVHSGFGSASVVLLENNAEFHYIDIANFGMTKFSENLVEQISQPNPKISFNNITAMKTRGNSSLTENDIIVFNFGIHNQLPDLTSQFETYGKFRMQCAEKGIKIPEFLYVTTPTQHFTTSNGQYSKAKKHIKSCQPNLKSNPRRDTEIELLKKLAHKFKKYQEENNPKKKIRTTNLTHTLIYDDLDKGSMHIADGDCSHYCMPGLPDVMAMRLYSLIVSKSQLL